MNAGEIVTALIETPDGTFRLPESVAGELPLMFSLRATKPLDWRFQEARGRQSCHTAM